MADNDEPPAWHGAIEQATDDLLARLDSLARDERRRRILDALEVALSDVGDDDWRPTPELLPALIFRGAFWEAICDHKGEGLPGMWSDPAVAAEIRSVVGRRVARAGDMPAAGVGVIDKLFPGLLDAPAGGA